MWPATEEIAIANNEIYPTPPEWIALVRPTGLKERLWDFGILWALRARMMTSKAFRIDRHRVLKWIATPTEALTMIYVAQHTSVPVPRVHAVVRHKRKYALIMDYINASEHEWANLSPADHASVAEQLAGYVGELRKLVPPRPGRVECVDGTACRDPKLNVPLVAGTIDDFHETLGHTFVLGSAEGTHWYGLREPFQRIQGRPYRTMFCHADLTWHNILIRDGKIVCILDWESGGWYPEYWEYTRLRYIWGILDVKLTFWNLIRPHLTSYEDEADVDLALTHAFSTY